MKNYSLYDPETGILTGQRYSGTLVEINTPPGLWAIEGMHDHTKFRVDTETGALIDWTPPVLDVEVLAVRARAERDRRLASCDWLVTRAAEFGEPIPPAWGTYRQLLRNVPEQSGFPTLIEWPRLPE